MKKALAVALIMLGCAWPFAAHATAMWKLSRTLSHDPRTWAAYTVFVVMMPCPAILYSGFIVYFREYLPFPANALFAAWGSAFTMVLISIFYYLVVGQIGFKVPL